MTFDLRQDFTVFFEDLGVDITLRPGTDDEVTIAKGCLPSRDFYQAEAGGKIRTLASAPKVKCLTSNVADLVQGDLVRIHPTPELLVAGGLFAVVDNQDNDHGFSTLELHEAEEVEP